MDIYKLLSHIIPWAFFLCYRDLLQINPFWTSLASIYGSVGGGDGVFLSVFVLRTKMVPLPQQRAGGWSWCWVKTLPLWLWGGKLAAQRPEKGSTTPWINTQGDCSNLSLSGVKLGRANALGCGRVRPALLLSPALRGRKEESLSLFLSRCRK